MFILAQFQPSQLQGAWPCCFVVGPGKKQHVMVKGSCGKEAVRHGEGELLISQQLAAENFLQQRPTSLPTFFKLRVKPSTQEIWGTFKIQIGPATTKKDFTGAIIWRVSGANYTLSRLARQVMPQKRGWQQAQRIQKHFRGTAAPSHPVSTHS